MTPFATTDLLRRANQKLCAAIESFRPERNSCRNLRVEDLSQLLAELLAVGECKLSAARSQLWSDSDFEKERAAYVRNLKELQDLLPGLQSNLLAERERLIQEQKHLYAAAAWAGSNRKTL